MSANTQTPGGEPSKTSAERADTTSANTGRKRKTPVKASTVADKGGAKWTPKESIALWEYRWRQSGAMSHREIGVIFKRSAQACRIELCKLLAAYHASSYYDVFGQQRPAGLLEPPPPKGKDNAAKSVAKNKKRTRPSKAKASHVGPEEMAAAAPPVEEEEDDATEPVAKPKKRVRRSKAEATHIEPGDMAAADGASEAEAHRLAKEEAADLSEDEVVRRATADMGHAVDYLRERAHREDKVRADQAAESMARGCALFRGEDGRRSNDGVLENNKTTTFADPETQARIEHHRMMMARYFDPVPHVSRELNDRELDAVVGLVSLSQGTGARPFPNPQFAAQRTPQDSRMSIESVLNDD